MIEIKSKTIYMRVTQLTGGNRRYCYFKREISFTSKTDFNEQVESIKRAYIEPKLLNQIDYKNWILVK